MSPAHILVVDDDIVVRRMVSRLLRDRGITTDLAASGEEAQARLAAAGAIDLLVCDLHLPGLSGLDLLAWIRGLPERGGLPVLVLTGQARDEEMCRAETLSDRVMTKPFSSVDLVETITELLEHRSRRAS